ncbi:MAG: hypothetical protein U0232_24710 [Thermomicrobiales bacterium]
MQIGVPDRVGESGGVGQQMAQRDRPPWRAKVRRSGVIEPGEHLNRGQLGHPLAKRFVQRQLAPLDQLQRRDGGDRLRHRHDRENCIETHRRCRAERALAERPS